MINNTDIKMNFYEAVSIRKLKKFFYFKNIITKKSNHLPSKSGKNYHSF